jgi:uncharacterized protein (DUF1684 family)
MGRMSILIIIILFFAITGIPSTARCDSSPQSIEAWRKLFDDDLRSPKGWLSVIALDWLKPGRNTFGIDLENSIILPAGSTQAKRETLFLEGQSVYLEPPVSRDVLVNGDRVLERLLLRSDADTLEDEIHIGRLVGYIINRSGKIGLRISDPESKAISAFSGRKWYPVKNEFHVIGRFQESSKPLEYKNAIGQNLHSEKQGFVTFSVQGKTIRMAVEGDLKEGLSAVFQDQTSGKTTYGAGRFLAIKSLQGDQVKIDLNLAFNPPCAFTKFATCPLAPKENHLNVAIEAGELKP